MLAGKGGLSAQTGSARGLTAVGPHADVRAEHVRVTASQPVMSLVLCGDVTNHWSGLETHQSHLMAGAHK